MSMWDLPPESPARPSLVQKIMFGKAAGWRSTKAKLFLVGACVVVATVLAAVAQAPSASADSWLSANERQYLKVLYVNNMQPRPWQTSAEIVAGGYWVCNILGNHSGGYVASQVWLDSNADPGGISYAQANTVVHAAIAHLCPWRWY